MYYYDYNDKNTVGKHLFFLCVNLNGLKRVSTGFNEGGGGGGEAWKRVWTDLNGLKRVSTGCNGSGQI